MIRVLHVLGGLGTGGTESLIMSWYRSIDRSKIQFDFLVRSPDSNYVDEIIALGGRVFYTASFPRYFLKNRRETKEVLQRKEWDVIHIHANAAMYMLPLRLAKKLGYKHRIMHSHSVKAQNPLFKMLHIYNRKRIHRYATTCLACSEQAGSWLYGRHEFNVFKNAVETSKYLFSRDLREKYRKQLQIEDSFVVGHIGRFAMPKNHGFLLEVFREISKRKPESKLLLVGDGELREDIVNKAKSLGMESNIVFTGRRTDIGALMSAMDVFVLPSLFEGMPVVCVECCASELPAVISEEAYVKELDNLPNLCSFSLKHTPEEWAEYVLNIDCNRQERGTQDMATGCGYDIRSIISDLESLYLK